MLKLCTSCVVFAIKAREAVEMRAQIEKKLAQKEKEKREENLRQLAQKAREERAGIRRADGMHDKLKVSNVFVHVINLQWYIFCAVKLLYDRRWLSFNV